MKLKNGKSYWVGIVGAIIIIMLIFICIDSADAEELTYSVNLDEYEFTSSAAVSPAFHMQVEFMDNVLFIIEISLGDFSSVIHYDFSHINWDNPGADKLIKSVIEDDKLYTYFSYSLHYAMRLMHKFDQINQLFELQNDFCRTISNKSSSFGSSGATSGSIIIGSSNSGTISPPGFGFGKRKVIEGLEERLHLELMLIYDLIGTMDDPKADVDCIRNRIQSLSKELYRLTRPSNIFFESRSDNYFKIKLDSIFSDIDDYTDDYEARMEKLTD